MIKIFIKIIKYPFRYFIKLKFFKETSIKNKFSIIYNNNYWDNKESFSGPGSTLKNTKNLRNMLHKIIKKYKIKSILDGPCGDCNWIQLVIKKNNVNYTGIDIVKECILKNKSKFNSKKFNFKELDITRDELPKSDLFICRDFMFHLSFEDNRRFLKNIKNLKCKYILISNHSRSAKNNILNKNIKTGDFRKINLFKEPFNFKNNYELIIDDYCDGVEKYLILFKIKEFKKNF